MFSSSHHDEAVKQILATYSTLKFSPPPSQWTILASIFLTNTTAQVSNVKIISIATGTKCLPTSRYPLHGEALHDSHAEILARRGVVRWVLDEIIRETEGGYPKSEWISRQPEGGKYALKDDGKLCLYVSTVPCGDASTRYLAAFQDPEMAALKDSQHTG
ncbi:hypothetical protein D9758_017983 [Tetrapyrgos nigripes]|uniref:A to I editase domain-containing protein n=1 Tax=Tetrapyrgos nigripes TaxID=182062 RepID=A0A8H5F9P0_9AGAR|nr:hypothetical protein D9758_017983 [Tetrapyrgos nigripes]